MDPARIHEIEEIRPRPAGSGMSDQDVEAMIRVFVGAFNAGEIWRIEPYVADHFRDHSPDLGGVDFRQRMRLLRQTMPDATLSLDRVVIQGDLVTVFWRVRGTHAGKLFGIAPTGRQVSISGVAVDRLRGGKVVEHWEFPDVSAFLRQFEGEPAPEAV